MPPHQLLRAWAADHAKQLAATVLFREADGGTLLESLHLPAAYCVRYAEAFEAGDVGLGAYTCAFELADPQGWSWQPGAPANPAVMQPAPGTHGTPPLVMALVAAASTPAVTAKGKAKLVANTPEHKAARWAEYQREHANDPKMWSEARWSKQYDTNMRNVKVGLGAEEEYRLAFGGTSGTLKTAFTNRQIDVYRPQEQYCGQLKTGKVSLSNQARIDLQKDADLIDNFFQVEYILEKGASKPFLEALDRIGATYKIGSQLP